jgi:hypothetical protein
MITPQGVDRPTSLRIGLVTADSANASPAAASVARGVRLGAAEAKQTAALFGNDVELYEAGVAGDAVTAAERLLSTRKIHVLIGTSAADAGSLSGFAESHHLIFLNTASRSQALRSACRRYTFHVDATDAMYANAARIAQQWPVTISAGASVRSEPVERPLSRQIPSVDGRFRLGRLGSGQDCGRSRASDPIDVACQAHVVYGAADDPI